nr:unnamed protein product [Vector pTR10BGal]
MASMTGGQQMGRILKARGEI